MGNSRQLVAGLAISAAAFIGIVVSEGYTDTAIIPTKNDRPTNGFGSTFNQDGSAVKLGESTTPLRALITAQAHISKLEIGLRKCIGDVPMYQYEYDAVVSWAYNVGLSSACKSTLVKKLKDRDYEAACRELPKWKYASGREYRGLLKRRMEEMNMCLGIGSLSNYP